MRPAIDPTESDHLALRSLFGVAADAMGSIARLARALRVTESVAFRADVEPDLVEALAEEVLGVKGRWVPERVIEPGDWRDESDDVSVAHGRLVQAVRAGDPSAVVAAARDLVREAEEASAAARLQVAR